MNAKKRVMLGTVMLVAVLAVSSPVQSNGGDEQKTDADKIEQCIAEKQQAPAELGLPEWCGRGLWLPQDIYLDMRRWADRGLDCDADIRSAVRMAEVRAGVQLSLVRNALKLCQTELDEQREGPSWWMTTLVVSGAVIVGGAIGAGSMAIAGAGREDIGQYIASTISGALASAIGASLVLTLQF